ncbi:hypothetical protein PINS_up011356 [Pythium insidiosum]|nr:hypothetical protein PINS_up011356 [Pythium insidiosum]
MSSLFKGVELANAKGDTRLGDECLQNKVVALLFAADWCPDCRAFQPTLNAFYKDVNQQKHVFDVVFVGSDATAADQDAHFKDKQGPWWQIPFASPLRDDLKRKYGVCAAKEKDAIGVTDRKNGIPSLVVIDANGAVVDLHAADKVEAQGVDAFAAWQQ